MIIARSSAYSLCLLECGNLDNPITTHRQALETMVHFLIRVTDAGRAAPNFAPRAGFDG